MARLAPGTTRPAAQAAMDALAARLADGWPELNRGRGITVFALSEVRIHPELDAPLFSAGAGLLAVVGLVLVLACANLANLLLVRGVSRTSEMAVRQAMGASQGRVARLFLAESLLLASAGGAAGLLLARGALAVLPRMPLPLPGGAVLDAAPDVRVLVFGVGLSLLTGLLFGLAPALRSAGVDVAGSLREERRSGAGRGVSLLRGALVGLQVAVSVILLVGASLLGRTLVAVNAVDPGFDAPTRALGGQPGGLAGGDWRGGRREGPIPPGGAHPHALPVRRADGGGGLHAGGPGRGRRGRADPLPWRRPAGGGPGTPGDTPGDPGRRTTTWAAP